MTDIKPLPADAKQFIAGYRAALNDMRQLADQREVMTLKMAMMLDHLHVDADDMERSARQNGSGAARPRRSRIQRELAL